MNTKLVQVDVESLQNQATHKQAMARLKEAGNHQEWWTGRFSDRNSIWIGRRCTESGIFP